MAVAQRWRASFVAACAAVVFAGSACAAPPTSPKLPAQKTAVLFGQKIRYFEFGRGPTVVLVHGLGSSARGDWGQVMQSIGRTHRVLALDLLGFGASDKPVIAYGIQTWVDFLGEFLRERHVTGDFTLMGESLGGWIAAQYTIQALSEEAVGPDYVLPKPSKLVLCDAAGFSKASVSKTMDGASTKLPVGISLAGQKQLLGAVFHDPKYSSASGLRTGMAWAIAKGDGWTIQSLNATRMQSDESVGDRLGRITIPTLVVWGQFDALVPLADGEGYAAGISGARLVVVPDSGHAPMIETPGRFLEAVGEFL
jgi:triacylglycerol lipase